MKWLVKQQNPKFGKIIPFWLMVLEFDKHHKRASPDLSIYIYSSISVSICEYKYIYIYICVYLLFAWNQLQWPTRLRTSLFPWSIYVYLSTYIHAYISCLHAISCSDPHLEHHCFEHSYLYLSLSNTHPWNGLSNNKTLNLAKLSFLVDGVGIWQASQES